MPLSTENKQRVDDFVRSVEITRDVRFQASLRLKKRQILASYIISLLSLFVIGLSLLPNFLKLEPFQNQILLACSIVLSVFVIFTSIIDGSQNFYHQSELLHSCGRQVARVYYQARDLAINAADDDVSEKLIELRENYQEALDDCPINHESCDFYFQKARKPHLFTEERANQGLVSWKVSNWVKGFFGSYGWMSGHVVALAGIVWVVSTFVVSTAPFQ
jgi:hypothetical protein